MANLAAYSKHGTIFVVPNRGLYIYGGGSDTHIQWLPSTSGSWSLDRNLYQSITTFGVCSVQVSKL